MASLREERPAEFSDDERWYKFFTNKSMIVFVLMLLFSFALARLFALIHIGIVGLILGIICTLAVMFIVSFRWPADDVMHGGGVTLDILLYRRLCRKIRGRVHIKGWNNREVADGNFK